MRLSEDLILTSQIRVSTDAAGTGVKITNLDESWQIHDSQQVNHHEDGLEGTD